MAHAVTVRSYADVEAVLRDLPTVQPGRVRTFRGQTRHYTDDEGRPNLLPAIARPGRHRRYDRGSLITMTDALIRGEAGHDLPTLRTLQTVWAAALVQHYASGSSFLDVSTDVTTALWFCLHRERRHVVLTDAGGGLNRTHLLACHTDWTDEQPIAPVVYVFDSECWPGSNTPRHGQLVQLLHLPVGKLVTSQATRLHAQAAALIYADVVFRSDSNLSEFLRCVLLLDKRFAYESIPGIGRLTTALFPEPAVDPIYRHLIAFPGAISFESGSAQLAHPLDLARYLDVADVPTAPSDTPIVLECEQLAGRYCLKCRLITEKVELSDPLYHAYLSGEGRSLVESPNDVDVGSRRFDFRRASVVLLQSPLVKFAPDAYGSEGACNWLQSVLPKNIAADIPGFTPDNVYLELSPLDIYRIDRAGGEMAVRAWWLASNHPHYAVSLFVAVPGHGTFRPTLRFRYDPATGTFAWIDSRPEDRRGPEQDDGQRFVVGTATHLLFLGLMLLRHLTPGFKIVPAHPIEPQSYASYILRLLNVAPKHTLSMVIEPQVATLEPLDPAGRYLVPRPLNGEKSYIGPSGEADWLDPMDLSELVDLAEAKLIDVKESSFLAFARALIAMEWSKAGEADSAIRFARLASEAGGAAGLEGIRNFMAFLEKLTRRMPPETNVVQVIWSMLDASDPGEIVEKALRPDVI